MELHIDAIERGEKIVLIDDLLATGGTSASAATLIKKVGGDLIEAIFLIELEFLHGREKLAPTPVTSFMNYCTSHPNDVEGFHRVTFKLPPRHPQPPRRRRPS